MTDEELEALSMHMALMMMPLVQKTREELAVITYSFYKTLSDENNLTLKESEEVRGAIKDVAVSAFISTISSNNFRDAVDELIDIVNTQHTLNEANKLLNNE